MVTSSASQNSLAPGRGRSLRQALSVLGGIVACIGAIAALQYPQLQSLLQRDQALSPEALQRDLEAEQLHLQVLSKLPTFDFDNLIADWVLLRFLQYFGDDEVRFETGYALSPDYFDLILALDPRFLEAYRFLSVSTSLYAGLPDRSVALMNRALPSLTPTVPPDSFYVWRYKGVDELLFLGDAQAARKSFETAAEWASQSPDEMGPAIAAQSRQTAQFLARNPASRGAQIASWMTVLPNVQDRGIRRQIVQRIEALGGTLIYTPDGQVQGVTIQPEN